MARILIIDDDATFGRIMQRKLERAGHQAVVRDGPFGTLNELKAGRYDAVLLDVCMPALDGTGLVQLIRGAEDVRRTPIVLCSSMDEDDLQRLAQRVQVDGYIPKSADLDAVVATLNTVLGRQRARA